MTYAPRLARRLLARAVPADVRAAVIDELDEMFRRRVEASGRVRAGAWYWRQALSFTCRFTAERLRERRGVTGMSTGFSWIDLKLALRMLVRYPGLATVGVLGMAVGIAIATGTFAIVFALLDPTLPLDEGDRVGSIVSWDTATNNREERVMHDLAAWRTVRSLEDLGVWRTVRRNLIAPGAQPETVSVAEMTGNGFDVARVSPHLGRVLSPEDEGPGSPDVVVIGHDVWARRFEGDPGILGRDIQLGATTYAIVGVMPEGFGFPVSHSFWIPWRLDSQTYAPRTGPEVSTFARLAPEATLEGAQSELSTVARRTAAASPLTHEHLRPRLKRFAFAYSDMDDPENALALHAIQIGIILLLVVVCVNVAILVYARTATRQGEVAVRSALGASRRRIVAQLFVEALVMAAVAAVVGVGVVAVALRQLDSAILQLVGALPFWMRFELSASAVLYVAALTVVAAGIVGAVPALKATGRGVKATLEGLSAGSGSRMQMGRLWTMLVVAQVAVTVALLPATMFHTWNALRFRAGDLGFAMDEFLTTEVALEQTSGAAPAAAGEEASVERFADRQAELQRRLAAEPAVAGVAISMVNPGYEWAVVAEVEGMTPPADPVGYNIVEGTRAGHLVRFNRVGVGFFSTYGVAVLMGRDFQHGDVASATRPVVIDRAFAERIFGGESPLGHRIRYVGRSREADESTVELNRWFEIVGVAESFPRFGETQGQPRVYHPAAPGDLHPVRMAVRVRGQDPTAYAGRLREISAAVDPDLQLRGLSSMEEVLTREQGVMRLIGVIVASVMLSVMVLSAAGIYALMSFTVSRRRREIGIRAALGADPTRILVGIFSRAFGQLAIGAGIGIAAAVGIEQVLEGEVFQGHGAVILPLVAGIMTVVGLLAAVGPARRGLRIQPTEALRAE
jgi:predicted permease